MTYFWLQWERWPTWGVFLIRSTFRGKSLTNSSDSLIHRHSFCCLASDTPITTSSALQRKTQLPSRLCMLPVKIRPAKQSTNNQIREGTKVASSTLWKSAWRENPILGIALLDPMAAWLFSELPLLVKFHKRTPTDSAQGYQQLAKRSLYSWQWAISK